jgi:hypothetical protein
MARKISASVEFGALIVSWLFWKVTCGATAAIESRGTCCTGPVGPEGNGGSSTFLASTFLAFFWPREASAKPAFTEHRIAALTSAAHPIVLNFHPVLITTPILRGCRQHSLFKTCQVRFHKILAPQGTWAGVLH